MPCDSLIGDDLIEFEGSDEDETLFDMISPTGKSIDTLDLLIDLT